MSGVIHSFTKVTKMTFKRNEKHDQEAAERGLTLLGAGKNYKCRLYRFDKCGHEQDIRIDSVRSNNFRCNQCQQDKHDQEAAKRGLTIVGKGKNRYFRLYRFNGCGHEQEIAVSSVRINSFGCINCCGTHWTKESGLYALLISDGDKQWIKIGVAKDVNTRIKQYKLSKTSTIDINLFVKIKDRITANKVEKFVQNEKLSEYKIDSEEMKNYMKSGYTECFSTEAWLLVETMFNKISNHFIKKVD